MKQGKHIYTSSELFDASVVDKQYRPAVTNRWGD